MVNDRENLLLGLYRESVSTETIEETSTRVVKRVTLMNKNYMICEEKVDHNFVWKIYYGEKELTRDEIVELYAECNLRRQMVARTKRK
jgi:hypothetical protein